MTREASKNRNPRYTPQEPRTERSEDIDRWCEKHGYPKPEIHNAESGIQLIIIAEEHLPKHQADQVELVKLVKPSVIIHEASGVGFYDPYEDSVMEVGSHETVPREQWSQAHAYFRPLFEAAHEQKIPIMIGDIPLGVVIERLLQKEPPVNYRDALLLLRDSIGPQLEKIAAENERTGKNSEKIAQLEKVLQQISVRIMASSEGSAIRDEYMARFALSAISEVPGPVVMIVGAGHAENIHHLGLLQEHNIGYAIIDQEQKE